MTNGNVAVIQNDVSLLRSKMESSMEFKKKIIGGVDEEDVIKYFKGIDDQLKKVEENFKVRIDEIENSRRKLQLELGTYKDNYGKAVAAAEELNGVIRSMKEEKLALQGKLETAENNVIDPQLIKERDNLAKRVSELEQEIWQVRKSRKLDDELKASYESRIDNLEKEIINDRSQLEESQKACSELEEQLQLEKMASAAKDKEYLPIREKMSGVEEQLAELRNQLAESHSQLTETQNQLTESWNQLAETQNQLAETQNQLEEGQHQLTESRSELAGQITLRTQLEERLEQSTMTIEELKEVQVQMEQKIGSENNGLSSWMSGIKNEMEVLYKQLADLEEMSSVNQQLEQQLMKERVRAEKAEQGLAQFGHLLSQAQNIFSNKD